MHIGTWRLKIVRIYYITSLSIILDEVERLWKSLRQYEKSGIDML
jgi:hypothetical protein